MSEKPVYLHTEEKESYTVQHFLGKDEDRYDLWQLVKLKMLDKNKINLNKQIICDLDKTYLETEFESLLKLARIPFEDAKDKITVNGANSVLHAFRWLHVPGSSNSRQEIIKPRTLHFVSSSPTQLRNVISEKLALDSLDWSTDTFKDQAYNIKMGKFKQLKHQVAYKSAAIGQIIKNYSEPGSNIILIGDSAEMDAFIYLGIKLFHEGYLNARDYQKYLEIAGKPENSQDLIDKIDNNNKINVKNILIRNLHNYPMTLYPPLTDSITLFHDYLDVSFHLFNQDFLEEQNLISLIHMFHNSFALPLTEIAEKLLGLVKMSLHLYMKNIKISLNIFRKILLDMFLISMHHYWKKIQKLK